MDINESVQFLKGVGPAKSELLKKIDIQTIKDLMEYYPRNYEDRTKLSSIIDFEDEKMVLFIATVDMAIKVQRIRKNLNIFSTFVYDDTGKCKLTFFNQTFVTQKLKVGQTYLFYGKAIVNSGKYSIITVENPTIYNVSDIDKIQGIYPIYTLTSGITQNYLFNLVSKVYDSNPYVSDIFSQEFKTKYNLCEINYAMKKVHFPKTFKEVEIARRRLIFEELFLLQLALMTIKNTNLGEKKENVYTNIEVAEFLELLPFKLTNAQSKVIKEIQEDMTSSKIMNRLIQGDVGSGKTIVAAIAMFIAVKNRLSSCDYGSYNYSCKPAL